jgi:hypothetical protein
MTTRPQPSPFHRSLLALTLMLSAGVVAAADSWPRPALPADRSPVALLRSLQPDLRERVETSSLVVTFEHVREQRRSALRLSTWSIAVLPLPADSVRGLLARASAYPAWVTLNPSYKNVRVRGAARITCEVGKSDSPRTKDRLEYEVQSDASGTRWLLRETPSPFQPDSFVAWEVVDHPTRKDSCVILHRQEGLLPLKGKLSKYLDSSDKKNRSRFWKDANKQARRFHWAFLAALSYPPGKDRKAAYLDDYQRDSGGRLPYWAK